MLQSFDYACNEFNIFVFFVFSDNQHTYSVVIWCLTSESEFTGSLFEALLYIQFLI